MSSTRQHPRTHDGSAPVDTMRAIVREEYGAADVLHLAQLPRPRIGDRQVLVRVRAAGVDRGVWHTMTGLPYLGRLAFGLRRPKNPVLGLDVAGTVAAVGPAVTGLAVGDAVYGTADGSFAEYAVSREGRLARMPANLTFEEAAVLPVSATTALQALHDAGRVAAGQHVLVIGASGGVGSYAVQLAKAAGADVTGVASAAKHDLVRDLGADHVLDHRTQDWADGAHRYDLVLDIAGNPTLARLRRALTPSGTAVIVGGENGGSFSGGMNRQLRALAMSPFVRQRFTMLLGVVRTDRLERLTALVESGALTPSLSATYPLAQAPQAVRDLVAGSVRGKVAVVVDRGASDLPDGVAGAATA